VATFTKTLATVAAMRPDRIAVYSYAHVPWLQRHQSRIDQADLPSRDLKFELIGAAVDTFGHAGYLAIGMDHFALPDDELAIAMRARRLHRNFMGYTTRPATDMVGAGLSAIGQVRGAFAQNVKKLPPYYAALDAGRFPIDRGYALSADDRIRQFVITELMCNFVVDRREVEARFAIDFQQYFATEIDAMNGVGGPVADGLATLTKDALVVTPEGRLFVRSVCMHFDRYLRRHAEKPVFSRTI
jgi:oxygen-independent coproporphyrinogen-3 oxidase